MMNHDIFISYSSKQKSIADGVCHYLEENGFKCWMAPRDIPVGSDYGDLIEEAIKTSKVVVLVFSQTASISKWVKGEINVAFTEDKPILPFRVDETEIKGGFRVMLNQMHWIDAFPHYADRLPDLLNSVCGFLGRQPQQVSNNNECMEAERNKSRESVEREGIERERKVEEIRRKVEQERIERERIENEKRETEIFRLKAIRCPEGAINGVFSVSPTKKVYFSKGNLQYQASTGIMRFAERQYDVIGKANEKISSNYDGWIDLFGWGTGDCLVKNTTDSAKYNRFVDWGINAIVNGGNVAKLWRTLTKTEWDYVLHSRDNKGYVKAQIGEIKGVILFPDNWRDLGLSIGSLNNNDDVGFGYSIIGALDWMNTFEPKGCVFLPAAGFRSVSSTFTVGSCGYYWMSKGRGNYEAFRLYFEHAGIYTNYAVQRYFGNSVRLVCAV